MMIAKLDGVAHMLAACLLATTCAGAVIEQAPSSPETKPSFEAITGPGYLQAVSTNSCVANNDCTNNSNVWITDVSAAHSNGQVNLTFTIAGGSNGLPYDVFAVTTMAGPITNAAWTWMGQGYRDVTYVLPELTDDPIFLLLGTPVDSDGDGLTDAYELLVSHSNPYVSNSIDPSMLDGWATLWNLNPFAIYDQQNFPAAPQARLDYWRFNTNTYQSEAGLMPANTNDVSLAPSWGGTALDISWLSWLSYPFSGPDGPSFNPNSGTIRFWYMPSYSSGTANGSGYYGTFFSFGSDTNSWTFSMDDNETQLAFGTIGNPNCSFFEPQLTVLQLQSNLWYQFTLTYSPTNVAIYTNGTLFVTSYLPPNTGTNALYNLGDGMVYSASASSQAAGFSFGNNNYNYGEASANGLLDELETFNYPLTAEAVAAGYPNFAGNATNMLDTYYVGRSDMLQTYVDGVFPPVSNKAAPCRLGYWRFDADNLMAEQGQLPLSYNDISLTPSWSGTALNINSDPASFVTYWDVFTNGWANINCRQGCLRFWFKPNWNSAPAASAPLFYLGNTNPALSQWSLNVNSGGAITFTTASNGIAATHLTSPPLPLDSGHWMQIVLNYGSSGSALYTNGALAATGSAVTNWPSLPDRNLGMVIGNNTAYNNSINGQFDEIETFNYQLAPATILSNFQTVQAIDSDLDGIPDLAEDIVLPAAKPFLGAPVVITGTIEAEQFDMGGRGIGYYNLATNPASAYRPTGMCITNCDDLGLGYCLDQTRAGEWAQYTIHVLVPQTYTIETRVAGQGSNGVFECEFSDGSFYTNTGPLTITTTNWTNVSAVVWLTNGIYTMKLRCLTNGTDGAHVGRFNYISIYSWWQAGFTSTHTNTVTGLNTNNDWTDATNNAAIIQRAINTLPATGGTVLIPAGSYYVSQASPNEANAAWNNAAVTIMTNNVEIAGAGTNNTTLIAFNRATTIFCLGREPNGLTVQYADATIRDMAIEAQPHLAVTNYANGTSGTVFELGQLAPGTGNYTGTLTFIVGNTYPPNDFSYNVLVTNCQFLYGDFSLTIATGVSNCLVTHCAFNTWGGTNVYTGAVNNSPTNTPNTKGYGGSVGIFGGGYNVNILENAYNGNTNLVRSAGYPLGYANTGPDQLLASDGFVWFQNGGNIFIARNTILNNAVEGIQLNSGPNSVVGNTYDTLINEEPECALSAFGSQFVGGDGTTNPTNYSTCFIGNQVYGGRYGELAYDANGYPYVINFSGNNLTLCPPFNQVGDYPGSAISLQNCTSANVFGNTVVSGSLGVMFNPGCSNAVIMDNNFADVTYRGIGLAQYGGSLQRAAIINNILGQGSTFHVQLPAANSFGWFLYQNVYLNASSNSIPPFLDPASSAAHISD